MKITLFHACSLFKHRNLFDELFSIGLTQDALTAIIFIDIIIEFIIFFASIETHATLKFVLLYINYRALSKRYIVEIISVSGE